MMMTPISDAQISSKNNNFQTVKLAAVTRTAKVIKNNKNRDCTCNNSIKTNCISNLNSGKRKAAM